MTYYRRWNSDEHVTTIHQPVLLRDCVDLVVPALARPGSIAVDCTLGLAGHSTAFLNGVRKRV